MSGQGSLCLQIAGLVINGLLAVAAFWYTLETRMLRRQDREQLDLLRHQAHQREYPFVLPIVSLTNLGSMEAILKLMPYTDAERADRLARVRDRATHVSSNVHSMTEAIAHGLRTLIYDAQLKNYLISDRAMQVLTRESRQDVPYLYTGSYMEHAQVLEWLSKEFGEVSREAIDALVPGGVSYVVVVYFDLSDRLHMVKNEFRIEERNVQNVGIYRYSNIASSRPERGF